MARGAALAPFRRYGAGHPLASNGASLVFNTDEATRAAGQQGGSGGGGTNATIAGGGPNGEDYWEFTITSASGAKSLTVQGLSVDSPAAIGMWLRFPNPDDVSLFRLLTMPSSQQTTQDFSATVGDDYWLDGEWHFFMIPPYKMGTGLNAQNIITEIQFRFDAAASSTGTRTAHVAGCYALPSTKPAALIWLDDGNDTDVSAAALGEMTAQGLVGNVSIAPTLVGTSGFLTEAQITQLYNAGWSVCSHGVTELDTLTEAQELAELQSVAEYFKSKGWGEGWRHFVYPGGKVSPTVEKNLRKAGFFTGRSTDGWGLALDPLTPFHHINAKSFTVGTTATGAAMLDALDEAIKSRTTFGSFSHQVQAGAVGIHITDTEFAAYLSGVKERVDKGLVANMNIEDWWNSIEQPYRLPVS